MNPKILIVEDDAHIRLGLEEVLKSEGYTVCSVNRGDAADEAVTREKPALIILDVMLPGLSGYDVCKKLRTRGVSTPILMLTAKGQEMDKVIGLELGADDYVTKPFGLKELLARVNALLRRTGSGDASKAPRNEEPFHIGPSQINPRTYEVTTHGKTHTLTRKELELLQLFHLNPGVVLSREKLLNEVWGYEYYGTTRTLDQTIVQLRKKLGDSGSDARILQTVHGVGYRLAIDER